jgi:hypothetical protein
MDLNPYSPSRTAEQESSLPSSSLKALTRAAIPEAEVQPAVRPAFRDSKVFK